METKEITDFVRSTFKSWERVLRLSRKPRRDEFIAVTKITGLGALVVGVIGFLIRMAVQIINYVR
ncbi:MAG: protein translocase SEC61 complex subunit gamma [Methanobacteriota archaeon]|nr:MAG: protein translocase SEC61 complex subunit gamma [Euryarchaeota archaeon]